LNYFFDRGERHLGAFKIRKRAGEKAGKKPGLHLLTYWDIVDDAIPVDAKKYYPVQLADLISWSHTRRLMKEKYVGEAPTSWHELYKIAEGVLPFTRAELDAGRLSLLALYGGLIPESIEEEFGPDWLRNP
jgi:hypothetical protein